MFEPKKRGKGKNNSGIKQPELYKSYRLRKKSKGEKPEDIKLVTKIWRLANEKISQKILDGDHFKMPYRMGGLAVVKFERDFSTLKKNKFPLNYKETREKGYPVFHTEPFILKWWWTKKKAVFKWKSLYKFKACRQNTRGVKKSLNAGKDFYDKNSR